MKKCNLNICRISKEMKTQIHKRIRMCGTYKTYRTESKTYKRMQNITFQKVHEKPLISASTCMIWTTKIMVLNLKEKHCGNTEK